MHELPFTLLEYFRLCMISTYYGIKNAVYIYVYRWIITFHNKLYKFCQLSVHTRKRSLYTNIEAANTEIRDRRLQLELSGC